MPADPHADAQHDEVRKPHKHHRAVYPYSATDTVSVSVGEQDGNRNDGCTRNENTLTRCLQ